MNHSLLLCLLSVLAFCTSVAAQAPSFSTFTQTQALGSFNILDFGAVGDGQTDCTTAIQKSIDAASQKGGLVVIPAGRWRGDGHLELKMGVHLCGLNQAPQSWEPATGSGHPGPFTVLSRRQTGPFMAGEPGVPNTWSIAQSP